MTAPEETEVITPAVPTGWRGRLLPVNAPSGDGRMYTLTGEQVPVRPLPLAFKAQERDAEKHDGSVVVALITRVWLENGFVMGEGPFDLADPAAAEWARKLAAGFAGWVSVDFSDVKVEEVPIDANGVDMRPQFEAYERAFAEWEQAPPGEGEWSDPPAPPIPEEITYWVTRWKIGAATLVSVPAFEDARVWAVFDEFESTPVGPALVAAGTPTTTEHTGAMIALVPAETDALVVDGGDPAEELHLTLAYLGEADEWSDDARETLTSALGSVLGGSATGKVFGHARFNPNDPEKDPCAVYVVDSPDAREQRAAVWDVLETTAGLPALPENHEFIPHITAGYGVDVTALEYTGPVTFDRLRIAFAGDTTDLVLDTQALAASAGVQYRRADFFVPEPDHYVNQWQVDEDGRCCMHLAKWDTCHIGITGRCVNPPPGRNGYAKFHRVAVETDAGPLRVGKITMGTGHPSTDPSVTAAAAMAHYDNTGTLVAVVRVTDGVLGPWLSGHLVPWATPEQAAELSHHEVSGDWRGPLGGAELVAALAVNVPGFMEAESDDTNEALVAAGRPLHHRQPAVRHHPKPVTRDELRAEVRNLLTEFATEAAHEQQCAPLDARMREAKAAQFDRRMKRMRWGSNA